MVPRVGCFRARWLLPIDHAPIEGGWVETRAGRIVRIGDGTPPAIATDLGDVAILPGLVNTHTHLELSWMAGRVPPAESMDGWIRTLLHERRASAPGAEAEAQAARDAAVAMRAAGTVLVGDISNTLMTPAILAEAGLGGVVFHEILGFRQSDPAALVDDAWSKVMRAEEDLRDRGVTEPTIALTVAAHAPYSVSPALFREIARRRRDVPLTVHLGESAEEVEFLHSGTGPIRQMLETLDVWTDDWEVPRADPVRYLHELGYLQAGDLAVHGVHLREDGLARLRDIGAVIVTCPRSNAWVGAGAPPVARFYAADLVVAIGTDSLASAPSLSVFDELAALRRLAPEVSASSLLDSATRAGATALGFGAEYGSIAPGKRASLLAVDLPSAVDDVEEFLVSAGARSLQWLAIAE